MLLVVFHNPNNDKQKNFAGLLSTIFMFFYCLQYDVIFNLTHPRLYILYQFLIWCLMVTANIIQVYYHWHLKNHPVVGSIFICYAIADTVWIFLIGYLKFKGYRQYMYIIMIETIFHFMAKVTELLIIFIPIFGSHEMMTTNSVAFFILYEFFSLSYTDMLDLKYSKLSRLCLWLLIIFTTVTIGFEYFAYAFEQLVEDAVKVTGNTTSSSTGADAQLTGTPYYFTISKEFSELFATFSCYALLVLQFFIKKERKNK